MIKARVLFSFLAVLSTLGGCGTIPDMHALLHDRSLYHSQSDIVGPNGELTDEQSQRVISRLQQHQQTPSDILDRHLAFEQGLSDVPLVLGNKVTLLENGAATYQAMLAEIRGAHDSINMQTYTFTDGPVGQMFADALIERQRHGVQVNLEYDSLGSFSTLFRKQHGYAPQYYRNIAYLKRKLAKEQPKSFIPHCFIDSYQLDK